MERALQSLLDGTSRPRDEFNRLVDETLRRSAETQMAIRRLVRSGHPIQAGMLIESLFEDVIVAHSLVLDVSEREQLVAGFLEERDSIGERWRELRERTDFRVRFDPEGARSERSRGPDDPPAIRLRDLVARLTTKQPLLENLIPPFETVIGPGRDKGPFLDQLQQVIRGWLSQFSHTSAVTLTFPAEGESADAEEHIDQTSLVAFVAAWLFAMQVYLAAGFDGASQEQIEAIDLAWYQALTQLGRDAVGPRTTSFLLSQWINHYGDLHDGPGSSRP